MTLTQYGTEFLNLALVHLLVLISPGPDFAISVRQSLRFGREVGIATALGITAGLSIHVLYTLLGAGTLLRSSPWLMRGTAVAGALYLLYLGIRFLRSAGSAPVALDAAGAPGVGRDAGAGQGAGWKGDGADPGADQTVAHAQATDVPASSAPRQSLAKAFWLGFFTNATNPKAPLFFLAVFASMVGPQTPLWVQGLYGTWMCALTALWYVLVTLVFTHRTVREKFLRINQGLERVMGVLLQLFALRLLWQVWKDVE